jgi:hypothetical protein
MNVKRHALGHRIAEYPVIDPRPGNFLAADLRQIAGELRDRPPCLDDLSYRPSARSRRPAHRFFNFGFQTLTSQIDPASSVATGRECAERRQIAQLNTARSIYQNVSLSDR